MSHEGWYCEAADEDGFVPLRFLQDEAESKDEEEFAQRFPSPGLWGGATMMEGFDDDPEAEGGHCLLTLTLPSPAVLSYVDRIAFVTKRPGNPFPHLISVGRSPNNDVRLTVSSISKVHGYFVRDDAGWAFNDHNSTNGSFLDGRRLTAGESVGLSSESSLRLGLDVTLTFFDPTDLWSRLRRL